MENQSDFLKKLDTSGSYVPPAKPLSPDELRLQELLIRKDKLEITIDNCSICDKRSLGVCGQDHQGQWRTLLKEIDEAESNVRGK